MSIQSAPLVAITLCQMLPEPKRTLGGRLGSCFTGTELRLGEIGWLSCKKAHSDSHLLFAGPQTTTGSPQGPEAN